MSATVGERDMLVKIPRRAIVPPSVDGVFIAPAAKRDPPGWVLPDGPEIEAGRHRPEAAAAGQLATTGRLECPALGTSYT